MKKYICFALMIMNGLLNANSTEGNVLNENAISMLYCNQSSSVSNNKRMDKLETIIDRMGKEMTELKMQNENLVNRVQKLESSENVNMRKSRIRRAAELSNSTVSLAKKSLCRYLEYPDMKNQNVVPNSCNDLQLMGHTLNGFYSVQGRDKNANRIETIFCNFSETSTLNSTEIDLKAKNEKRVGFLDIKTKSVYFYVQKNKAFTQSNERISFEVEYLNIGKAFDLSSSVFTAPVNGIYTFSFSCLKGGLSNEVSIFLRLNGKPVGMAYMNGKYEYVPTMMQSTLKLEAGNTIDMWLVDGYIHDHEGHHTHFIGWLQEEELVPGK